MRFCLIFIASFFIIQQASACQITMGYRTNERAPLIAKAPNNQGLYFDLFSLAAKKVGCQLQVVRKPKKRILKMMRNGEVDFYPGFNFSLKRAKNSFFCLMVCKVVMLVFLGQLLHK